ncbi:MAG: PAS domain-containing protein, partial [Vibrio sp.]
MSEELSQTIINHQVTAVFILDETLLIRYANPAAEQLFSQSVKRLMNYNLHQLVQHSSLDLQLLTQPLQSGQSITDSDVT